MTFDEFQDDEGDDLYEWFRKFEAENPGDDQFHRALFAVALKRGFLRGQENQLDLTQVKVG